MTLIAGLRCADAAVLAADSQGTFGDVRKPMKKLFATSHGIIWGTAGPIPGAQALEARFSELILDQNPSCDDGRQGIRKAMLLAAADMQGPDGEQSGGLFEGLFAWHAGDNGCSYLLRARSDGQVVLMDEYGTVGSSSQLADFAFFGFSRSAYLEYETLPLEAAKMLVHTIADDAVRASAKGVDGPIQLAVVTANEVVILSERELQLVRDTASAFQMHQADFLIRKEQELEEAGATGLVPGDGDS
jgi:20S proteasome alpha/beta subunit